MWLARSELAVQAWLGAGRVAIAPVGEPVFTQAVVSPQEGLATLASRLKDPHRRKPVRLWLGSDLCTLTALPAVSGVNQLEDAQPAAKAWLETQGRVPPGWATRLAECRPEAPLWRVAVWPEGLLAEIRQQLVVRSIRPWWSWAMQQLEDRGRGLCAYDGSALVFCDWDAAGHAASAETVGPLADIDAARRLLKRRSVQQRGEYVFAHLDWNRGSGAAAGEAAFAFAPFVRWGDAL